MEKGKGEIIQFPSKDHPHAEVGDTDRLNITVLVELLKFLTSLAQASPESKKRSNIEFRREILLKNATPVELIAAVNNSSRTDWQTRPAYYHALVAELMANNLIPDTKKFKPGPDFDHE